MVYKHIIIISIIVFTVLNIIENIIHYNIGKSEKQFIMPNLSDFIKILFTMFIFGLLQGIFTEYFSEIY